MDLWFENQQILLQNDNRYKWKAKKSFPESHEFNLFKFNKSIDFWWIIENSLNKLLLSRLLYLLCINNQLDYINFVDSFWKTFLSFFALK